MRKNRLLLLLILFIFFHLNCKQKSTLRDDFDYEKAEIIIKFHREHNSNNFEVIVNILNMEPNILKDANILIYTSRGEIISKKREAYDKFKAKIITDGTGEYNIKVVLEGTTKEAEKTALVLSYVNEEWDQPEKVRGFVNTKGWEDGACISSDGKWLFIQYLPVPINCLFSADPNSPFCRKAIGPITAPYRPDMPGADRVSKDGTIKHECPSLNFFNSPFPVPPNSLYVFKREKDGSFKNPQPIYFAGADGCISAFGPALLKRESNNILLFAFDNPLQSEKNDTQGDLYALPIIPGEKTILGKFEQGADGNITLKDFKAKIIGDPTEGHQGNPHHWINKEGKVFVFYDDENERKDLFVVDSQEGINSENWNLSLKLPSSICDNNTLEAQPFFDGQRLYFRRELEILSAKWRGGDFSEPSSWEKVISVLKGDGFSATDGHILGVGEPTVAKVDAHKELYFIYIIKTKEGIYDLNVGMVRSR